MHERGFAASMDLGGKPKLTVKRGWSF